MTSIDAHTMIPDLVRAHPSARTVLDRYGLHGCGGPNGPAETIAFFARAHGVDLEALITELREAAAGRPAEPADSAGPAPVPLADRIYRRFFAAAILFTLTAGAAWGAYLLFRIGENQSFTALSIHDVNAHGHVQIFGWVGLFVMGFAYQAFGRFRHGTLSRPELANVSFVLMVAGVLGRFTAGWFWQEPWALPLGVMASVAEVGAVAIFAVVTAMTLRRAPAPQAPYESYIAASILWFLAATVFSGVHFAGTMSAGSRDALIHLVAVWQPPLRETQIAGFALLMILGVNQRFLAGMYGFASTPPRRSRRVLVLLNVAIAGQVVSVPWFMLAGDRAALGLGGISSVALLVSALWLVVPWRLWRAPIDPDRSVKFVRAAYLWLFVALGMVVLTPVYHHAAGITVSHAYAGAARHAITVGFISMMILGVSSKVVPTLAGLDLRRLSGLWPTFLLVNLGCLLRVTLQIATDHTPATFGIIGASGLLELAGIALWAAHLGAVMVRARRVERGQTPAQAHRITPGAISLHTTVADAITAVPGTLDVLVRAGFAPLKNPVLRRTLARTVTLDQACRRLGRDPDSLVRELNALPGEHQSKGDES